MSKDELMKNPRATIVSSINEPLKVSGDLKDGIEELAIILNKDVAETIAMAIGVFLTASDSSGEVKAFNSSGKTIWASGKLK